MKFPMEERTIAGDLVYMKARGTVIHLTYPVLKKLMTRLVRLRKQFLGVKCIIEFKVGRCFIHLFHYCD